ncbi:MAG: hypothetical protein JSV99_02330 [Planctomycetota bacterium]|nr:MAG: hypothetical protein JSV99_02330 [Planctomycetota bacterium]
MKEVFFVLDTIPLQVSPEDVLKQLGYPDKMSVPPGTHKKVDDEIGETQSLIEPKGAYCRLDGVPEKGFELFSAAEGIVLALATIGPKVERRAGKFVRTDRAATGVIADAIGTVAVEQTADFLERKIHEDCANFGWKVSRRYAPGYCGWAMEAQKEIFSHFSDTLGIKLTNSCLMIPEKSLSFVCLLSREGDFSKVKVGNCKRCRQKDCPYRSEPYKPRN